MSMTLTDFIKKVWVKSNGEMPSFVAGSDDWNRILTLANYYIDQWANEPGVVWSSLYSPKESLGTISATDTYDLDPDTIRELSHQSGDKVQITHLDGTTVSEYDIVPADELKSYDQTSSCARVGDTLVFANAFKAGDSQIGGALTVPAYLYPEHLESTTDEVPVDNPNWLVAIVASDVARNDILRKDQYPILSGEANSIMEAMKAANEGQLNRLSTNWQPFSGGSGWTGNYNGYGDR